MCIHQASNAHLWSWYSVSNPSQQDPDVPELVHLTHFPTAIVLVNVRCFVASIHLNLLPLWLFHVLITLADFMFCLHHNYDAWWLAKTTDVIILLGAVSKMQGKRFVMVKSSRMFFIGFLNYKMSPNIDKCIEHSRHYVIYLFSAWCIWRIRQCQRLSQLMKINEYRRIISGKTENTSNTTRHLKGAHCVWKANSLLSIVVEKSLKTSSVLQNI